MQLDDSVRVLVVEDDADSLDLLLTMFRHASIDAIGVESGEEGLALMRARRFDFVVSDHNLPGMSGGDMLEQAIHEGLLAPARAIVCTADPFHHPPHGVRLMRKPVQLAVLRDLVTKELGERPRVGPPTVSLVLYVAGTVPSTLAIANVERAIARLPRVDLVVRDLRTAPWSGAPDRIRFTPTLVRHHPPPKKFAVGDLRDVAMLESFFDDAAA